MNIYKIILFRIAKNWKQSVYPSTSKETFCDTSLQCNTIQQEK